MASSNGMPPLPPSLLQAAKSHNFPPDKALTCEFATLLDSKDPLKSFRSEFYIPKDAKREGVDPEFGEAPGYSIYFCGNSLGLLSKRAESYVQEECQKWKKLGVEGHFNGKRPWATIDEEVTEKLVDIVGATDSSEVAVMNSLSCNLHMLLTSFYQPSKERFKIIMEDAAFCSDHHVIQSQVELRGLDKKSTIITVKPREGSHTLLTKDILDCIEEHSEEVALVFLGGVQYYTGQFYDLAKIAKKAHHHGALMVVVAVLMVAFAKRLPFFAFYSSNMSVIVENLMLIIGIMTAAFMTIVLLTGVDLAHAAGNVPLSLHDWEIDFAAWCTYKYLNAGPGSIGGIFVHKRFHGNKNNNLKIMAGWWGQKPKTRFQMKHEWEGIEGAQAWQVSNPAVLPTVCLQASLDIFKDAGGMKAVRKKSLLLTGLLEYLIECKIEKKLAHIITPRDPERRGCQLSLLTTMPVKPVHEKLEAKGVIVDVREPNVIRLAPCPLYNTFSEVFRFVEMLQRALVSTSKL
eukprot:jgi/Bigna1/85246/estExt_fgenesh1_pg.C_30056